MARGLAVFPLPPGAKVPTLKNWPDRCVSDPETITRHWRHGDNIGVGCKANDLLGVDLDRHHKDADGVATFSQLCRERGQGWPDTLTVLTPSGGLHLYFRAPHERALGNSSGKLGPGIDTRGPGKGTYGGYLVAPGSVVDGRTYEIVKDLLITELPSWLTELLDPPQRPFKPVGELPKHQDRYVQRAIEGEVQRVLDADAAGGGRNDALNASAFVLGTLVGAGALDQLVAETALRAAAEAVGLIAHTGERQVDATIRSGLTAGIRRPRYARGTR